MPGKEIKGRSKIAKYRAGGRVKRAGGGPGLYANIAAKKADVPPSVKASLEFKQSVSKSKVKESKKLKEISYKWDKIKGKKK